MIYAAILVLSGLQASAELPTEATAIVEAARALPSSGYISAADYPRSALVNREEGEVEFRLSIGTKGRATGCEILKSSGSAALDSTTCRLLVKRARFRSARDAEGKAVPDAISNVISWRLP
jgi:protein TonB